MIELYEFLKDNWDKVAIILVTMLAFLEAVVRVTPTTKDDAFLERVGAIVRKVLDFMKVPNVRKGG